MNLLSVKAQQSIYWTHEPFIYGYSYRNKDLFKINQTIAIILILNKSFLYIIAPPSDVVPSCVDPVGHDINRHEIN